MIGAQALGIHVGVILHPPLQQGQGHVAVGEVIVGIVILFVDWFQLEHFRIKLGATFGVKRTQCKVAEMPFRHLHLLGVHILLKTDIGLGYIEDIGVGIMAGIRRIGPYRRPLDGGERGVEFGDAGDRFVDILDLETEMIEPRGPPLAPGDDVHADAAVAHHRGAGGAIVLGAPQPEQGLVEARVDGVLVRRDGDMIKLCKHVPKSPVINFTQTGRISMTGPEDARVARTSYPASRTPPVIR